MARAASCARSAPGAATWIPTAITTAIIVTIPTPILVANTRVTFTEFLIFITSPPGSVGAMPSVSGNVKRAGL
jgi:hypothetical protein